MMVSLRRPSTETIREFLASQSKLGFTYTAVGATASLPPADYVVDHTRIKLGQGEEVFMKAKAALGRWQQFRLGWVEVWSPETPIQTGEVVAVIARNVGLWWLNACRIVYVVDEEEPIQRYGFAYGTLPDHAETGEERFLVERDRASGEVWYDILAFSRPHLLLTRLGYPFVRRVQKRFAKASAAAMLRVVNNVERGSNREEEP
jgi:uncharacterized protein (UPF0548 family)